jgi:hypothetical protein
VTSGEGYALTAGEIIPDIGKGEFDTTAVSTRSCVN